MITNRCATFDSLPKITDSPAKIQDPIINIMNCCCCFRPLCFTPFILSTASSAIDCVLSSSLLSATHLSLFLPNFAAPFQIYFPIFHLLVSLVRLRFRLPVLLIWCLWMLAELRSLTKRRCICNQKAWTLESDALR